MAKERESAPLVLVELAQERLVLSSIFDGELPALVKAGLTPDHFAAGAHRWFYRAATALHAERRPVDSVTIAGWLRDKEQFGQLGGPIGIAKFADEPAATGDQLQHHVASIIESARARQLIATCERIAAQARAEPSTASVLLDDAQHTFGDLLAGQTSTSLFAPVHATHILEPDPDVSWLVEELGLSSGAPVLFAGYGYSGKTAAAQALALAVASGSRAFGWFACRRGRTLHLDYEQGLALTKKRYRRLAIGAGIDIRECANELGYLSFPRMLLEEDRAEWELCRACEDVSLLIIDSLKACAPSLEENSSEMRRPLDMLTRVAEKTGVVPLVIHHARKPSKDDPPGSRYAIRGSASIFDACASVFVLAGAKDDPKLVSHEKDRARGQTHEDFYLAVEDVDIDGQPKAGLRVAARTEEVARPVRKATVEFEQKIAVVLDYISKNPGCAGKRRIAETIKMRFSTVSEAVNTLVERGHVEDRGSGKPFRPSLFPKHPSDVAREAT